VDCCQLWELFFGAPRVTQSHAQETLAPPPTASLAVAALAGPVGSARIKVLGVGGGGGNAVNRMIASGLRGTALNPLLLQRHCSKSCYYLYFALCIVIGQARAASSPVPRCQDELCRRPGDCLMTCGLWLVACGL